MHCGSIMRRTATNFSELNMRETKANNQECCPQHRLSDVNPPLSEFISWDLANGALEQ